MKPYGYDESIDTQGPTVVEEPLSASFYNGKHRKLSFTKSAVRIASCVLGLVFLWYGDMWGSVAALAVGGLLAEVLGVMEEG